MIYGLLRMVRETVGESGFATYLSNLQRENWAGTPTVREAKRDYQALIRSGNVPWMI